MVADLRRYAVAADGAAARRPQTCLGAKARDLFALLPKSNFWLNPRSECQKPLRAEEIALIMNRKIFDIDFAGAAKPSN